MSDQRIPKPQPIKTAALATGAGGFFAALVLAAGLLETWEGKSYEVYLDGGGVPTVCNGHTGPDVKMGQPRRTAAQCRALLERDAFEHGIGLQQCLTVDPPISVLGAFISFATNVGVKAACGSTAVRLINAKDYRGACAQMSRWTFDNGKHVRGLANRRNGDGPRVGERQVCERDI